MKFNAHNLRCLHKVSRHNFLFAYLDILSQTLANYGYSFVHSMDTLFVYKKPDELTFKSKKKKYVPLTG